MSVVNRLCSSVEFVYSAKMKRTRPSKELARARLQVIESMVNNAKKIEDPLAPLHAFKSHTFKGIPVNFYIKWSAQLDDNAKAWIFDLLKRNMKKKYEQCSWGWNDKKKARELFDEAACYLLAETDQKELVAYSHFRFDVDQSAPVLYCYELQLEPRMQRKGLGKFMMQILELMAFRNHMEKVILTVLKNNEHNRFFKLMNYQIDDTSPTGDEFAYEIISKINNKFKTSVLSSTDHFFNLKRYYV